MKNIQTKKLIAGLFAAVLLVFSGCSASEGACTHKDIYSTVVKGTSCTDPQVTLSICEQCNAVMHTTVSEKEHSFGDYIITVEPTADKPGIESRVCEVCHLKEEREYVCPHANTHIVIEIQATGALAGKENVICDHCSTVLASKVIPPTVQASPIVSVNNENKTQTVVLNKAWGKGPSFTGGANFSPFYHANIAAGLHDGMTEREAIDAIHRWICRTVSYKSDTTDFTVYAQLVDPYTILSTKEATCVGYAKLFSFMCLNANIDCKYIEGKVLTSNGQYARHAWNMVKVNGDWLYMDVCWNDCCGATKYYLSDTLWSGYVREWSCDGPYPFDYFDKLTSVSIEGTVKENAFAYCNTLTNSIVSGEASRIEKSAFFCCSNLETVVLDAGITSIGDYAFRACTNLKSITIPSSVKSIGTFAFDRCENLTTIYYAGSEEQWKNITFGSWWAFNAGTNAGTYTIVFNA